MERTPRDQQGDRGGSISVTLNARGVIDKS